MLCNCHFPWEPETSPQLIMSPRDTPTPPTFTPQNLDIPPPTAGMLDSLWSPAMGWGVLNLACANINPTKRTLRRPWGLCLLSTPGPVIEEPRGQEGWGELPQGSSVSPH